MNLLGAGMHGPFLSRRLQNSAIGCGVKVKDKETEMDLLFVGMITALLAVTFGLIALCGKL